jgi:hypothetical protein
MQGDWHAILAVCQAKKQVPLIRGRARADTMHHLSMVIDRPANEASSINPQLPKMPHDAATSSIHMC